MEQEPDERQTRELQAFMEMEVRAPCSDVRRRKRAGANLSPRFLVPIMRRGGKVLVRVMTRCSQGATALVRSPC